MTDYDMLTQGEKAEISNRIVNGDVLADEFNMTDEFDFVLQSGRRVIGMQSWGNAPESFDVLEIM